MSEKPKKQGPQGSTWIDLENKPVGFAVGSDFKKKPKELVSGVREEDPYGPVMAQVGKRQTQNGRSNDPLLSAGIDDLSGEKLELEDELVDGLEDEDLDEDIE